LPKSAVHCWGQDDGTALDGIIAMGPGWERFRTLVATAGALTNVLAADPLSRVLDGYHRFRLYAPGCCASSTCRRRRSRRPWAAVATFNAASRPRRQSTSCARTRNGIAIFAFSLPGTTGLEIAVLFHIRDAFRSGDIWLAGSRRYADLKQILVPARAIEQTARLTVPLRPHEWLRNVRPDWMNG
jgi:hypothetical protein